MSTAAITNGDLIVAMQEGIPIAEGIAFDPEGAPTTNADAALKGSVRPFGQREVHLANGIHLEDTLVNQLT